MPRLVVNRLLDRVVAPTFWALSAICLLNLNGLAFMWAGVERAFSLWLLLCCVVALAGLVRVRPTEALGVPGMLLLAALASYAGIGIVVSVVTGTDLRSDAAFYLVRHVNSAFLTLAAAVGGLVVWRRSGGERLLRGLLVVMVGSCLLVLASPLLVEVYQQPPEQGRLRYSGSFYNPNDAGMLACFTVVLALACLRAGRFRPAAHGALLVASIALVLTFSRTALMGAPVLLAHCLLWSRGVERRRLVGALALAGIILGAAVANLDTGALQERQLARWESVLQILERRSVDDVSLGGRLALWRIAADMALQAPLFGHGLGTLHRLEGAWYDGETGVLLGAHNQYLVLIGEAGFVPLVLFLLFLGTALWSGLRAERDLPLVGAVSGWILVVALFSLTTDGILTKRYCNFVIGVGCAVLAGSAGRQAGGQPGGPDTSAGGGAGWA